MKIIIDSGSSKCDWICIDKNKKTPLRIETKGLNPNLLTSEQIQFEIQSHTEIVNLSNQISSLFFYGAGCGRKENQQKMHTIFSKIFPTTSLHIHDDLTGASHSLYTGNPMLVGILGTGANIGFFDGEKLNKKLPSLGFLLGDEGSGFALGREFIKNLFMQRIPKYIYQDFEKQYPITTDELIQNCYQKPKPNAFLAKFSPFILKHINEPFIIKMVEDEFQKFFDYQVLPYPESQSYGLSLVGSIAHYYRDILKNIASKNNVEIHQILHKPIENLILFHQKN